MDEEHFKLIAIKYLLEQEQQCLALEVPFIDGSRRADIVSVNSSNEITAYEIKSERDNLDSLQSQLSDYLKVFDFTYVILAKRHIEQARPLIPRFVGIIVIGQNGLLSIKRKARRRLKLEKRSLAASVDKQRITTLLGGKIKNQFSTKKIYNLIDRNLSTETLRNAFRSQLIEKYGTNFQIFRNEIGTILHAEDLLTLGIERRIR